jgi:hypothetical protein
MDKGTMITATMSRLAARPYAKQMINAWVTPACLHSHKDTFQRLWHVVTTSEILDKMNSKLV